MKWFVLRGYFEEQEDDFVQAESLEAAHEENDGHFGEIEEVDWPSQDWIVSCWEYHIKESHRHMDEAEKYSAMLDGRKDDQS